LTPELVPYAGAHLRILGSTTQFDPTAACAS
jgi:hypothetical protein